MLALGIKPQQNVILVGSPQEKPRKVELSLGQIGFRFKLLKVFLVSNGQHNDGASGVHARLRKYGMKNHPHALELIGDVSGLFFA